MLETDRELLDGFRKGERQALERVYRAHVDDMVSFFRRGFRFESSGRTMRFQGVSSTFQLEDWVHEVFVRAFSDTARTQYDGLRPYGPYLERVARNMVLDNLRRREHRLMTNVQEIPEPGEASDFEIERPACPEEQVRKKQLQEDIEAFLADLPEREREVYLHRFRLGLEQKDVARKVGISVSKVKTSEKRIRERFYAFLAKRGWVDAIDGEMI